MKDRWRTRGGGGRNRAQGDRPEVKDLVRCKGGRSPRSVYDRGDGLVGVGGRGCTDKVMTSSGFEFVAKVFFRKELRVRSDTVTVVGGSGHPETK